MTSTWNRLLSNTEFLLVVGSAVLGALALVVLPLKDLVDPLLLFPVLAMGIFFALRKSHLPFKSPLYAYFSMQLLYCWFAVDFLLPGNLSPQLLAVGFATLSGVYWLFKDFKYYWDFPFFRCLLFFVLFSVVSLVLWGSDFKLGALTGYLGLWRMTEAGDTNAKTVVFLSSYITFLSSLCGLAVFYGIPNKEALGKRLVFINNIIVFTTAFFCAVAFLKFKGSVIPGQMSIMVVMYFMVLTALFAQRSQFLQKMEGFRPKVTMWAVGILPALSLLLIVALNKTALLGSLISFTLFLGFNHVFVPWVSYLHTIRQMTKPLEFKFLFLLLALLSVIGFVLAGGLDIVAEKMDYFINGFSKLSTLRVRTGNWYYFNQEWLSTLDFQKMLFGYGLGKSRETIFFISVMRMAHENTMVQTLHNSYLEHLYDYGAMSLLMYGASLLIFIDNLRKILDPKVDQTLKLYCVLSVSSMVFVAFYGLADGVRIHVLLIYYSLLGMVEGLKHAWFRLSVSET